MAFQNGFRRRSEAAVVGGEERVEAAREPSRAAARHGRSVARQYGDRLRRRPLHERTVIVEVVERVVELGRADPTAGQADEPGILELIEVLCGDPPACEGRDR